MVADDIALPVVPLADEVWRPIPGFLHYFASSAGRIATTPRRSTPGGLLKQNRSQRLRPRVSVAEKPGWPQTRERVAKLVCLAFNGPRPSELHVAAHLDRDPLNNSAANLAWLLP